jgi:hypothetical protein
LKYQTNLMSKTVKNSWTERSIHFRKRKEELLSNLIERGEVRRLSNGKWMCDVCPHHPVLDTVEVLAVHRTGKRHQSAVEEWKTRKEKSEIRKHFNNVQTSPQKRKMSENIMPVDYATKKPAVGSPPLPASASTGSPSYNIPPPLLPFGPLPLYGPFADSASHLYDADVREWYLTLYSRGWKLDAENRWYRDPNVEFDEDESLPAPPEHIRHLVYTEVVPPPTVPVANVPASSPSADSNSHAASSSPPADSTLHSIRTDENSTSGDNSNLPNTNVSSHPAATETTRPSSSLSGRRTLSEHEKQRRKKRKAKQKALKRAAQQNVACTDDESQSTNSSSSVVDTV